MKPLRPVSVTYEFHEFSKPFKTLSGSCVCRLPALLFCTVNVREAQQRNARAAFWPPMTQAILANYWRCQKSDGQKDAWLHPFPRQILQQLVRSLLFAQLISNKTAILCLFMVSIAPSGPGLPHYRRFTITLRHNTLGRNSLEEWSARRRDLYLTTQNTRNRETSMPPPGFEPAIPASERPPTHALDRAATWIGMK